MNTKYNYYCLDCSTNYVSEKKANRKLKTKYGEFDGTKCPLCGGNAKMVGVRLNFSVINGECDVSRKEDLDILSDYAGKGVGQAKDTLDKVYKKSKDPVLASMRKELINAHKKADVPKSEVVEGKIRKYEKQTYGN